MDNEPSNFTQGDIRDAWVIGATAYVVTEDNKLYKYNGSSWDFIGNYDVKKIEYPPLEAPTFTEFNTKCSTMPNIIFMLTNDGKLYHKGEAIDGVAEEHTEFTQIFPDCYFHDFTFGSGTLTVLKD